MRRSLSMRLRTVSCIVFVLIFMVACQGQQPPTPQSETAAAIDSGGLGLPRSEWEQQFGPIQDPSDTSGFADVGVDKSAFVKFAFGRVTAIVLHLTGGRLTKDEARDAAMRLLPSDSVHLDSSTDCRACRFWVTTDRFISDALAQVHIPCSPWRDARPGEIAVSVQHASGDRRSPPVLVYVNWACR
jgi:hypothetical protein